MSKSFEFFVIRFAGSRNWHNTCVQVYMIFTSCFAVSTVDAYASLCLCFLVPETSLNTEFKTPKLHH